MGPFRYADAVASGAALALVGVSSACTFTGLADYAVDTCPQPLGATTTVEPVGALGSSNDIVFTQVDGQTPLLAYRGEVGATVCVEGIGEQGALASGCDFFGSGGLSPRQPWITPLSGGYLAAAVATTAPFTQGVLSIQFGPGEANLIKGPTSSSVGAALPAAVVVGAGSDALVAWYETAMSSRGDPLQSCSGAKAAPLQLAGIQAANGNAPAVGTIKTLTAASISIRPPALTPLPGHASVAVAAPDGDSVSLWTVDDSVMVHGPTTIASLGGARAVAMGTDPAGNIAVVAEIGCAPQAIVLALGTSSGFGAAVTVAPAGSEFALAPSVAWVASQGAWVVSWISGNRGPHVLAQRVAPDGSLVGATLDPSIRATAATVVASAPSVPDGSLLAYVPSGVAGGSVVSASLGCIDSAATAEE